ncbi:MFS transporter [Salinibacterium sp. ZJ454]|uniref:MFS transporter n=1 Tax=Salinibacterium sp. ZJ454 TaxID=2708339 RepID=UPI001421A568|nr:MFS transporter [Salinibacterium sp. ZJ454]
MLAFHRGRGNRADTGTPGARSPQASPSVALFWCLFAGQASVLVLSPTLVPLARELGVSVSTAGQLRTISGVVAGVCALAAVNWVAKRVGLRQLVGAAALVLAVGSVLAALAPNYLLLALDQVLIGAALAFLISGATAAAGGWAPADDHTRVLSRALLGQPAAWVLGLPLIGLALQGGWRVAWLTVPVLAALLAATLVLARPKDAPTPTVGGVRSMLTNPVAAGWAVAELLAFSAWAGVLVYSGALFIESYAVSPAIASLLLAVAAAGYFPGNLLVKRIVSRRPVRLLLVLSLAMTISVAAFCLIRPGPVVSTVLLAVLAFFAGGRTLAGGAFGLVVGSGNRAAAMGVRAAAQQFGYFLGSVVGGLALAVAGYPGVAAGFAGLMLLAAAVYARLALQTRRDRYW